MYQIKILVVEDDKKLREILVKYLKKEKYEIEEAETGEEAIDFIDYTSFHLLLIDVMLPDMEGWDVLKYLRSKGNTPAIMLTARGLEEDKLHGFDLGADDYITKPYSAKELMARIKIQLRHAMPSQRSEVQKGQLHVEKSLRQVRKGEETLTLTALEYDLLMFFLDNERLVLSRQQLLDEVWGMDYYGDARTVDTHVKRLRQKLGDVGNCIVTVRGVGYSWEGACND